MATTRFADHLLEGDHASRPAFGDVPQGTLYSCSDHSLVYQSDGSTAWTTWATLGGTVADILDLPTAEMDDTLVLAPDGAGGVEFRAESGGGGGGGGGIVAVAYLGEDGTPVDIAGGTICTVTFTPAAGVYIVEYSMEVQRLSGTHANLKMLLDSTQWFAHGTLGQDVSDASNAALSDGVTYLCHGRFPLELTNASHTIDLTDAGGASMRYHRALLTVEGPL